MKINAIEMERYGCKMKVNLTDISQFEISYPEKKGNIKTVNCRGYSMNVIFQIAEDLTKNNDPVMYKIVKTVSALRMIKRVGGLRVQIRRVRSDRPIEELIPNLIIDAYDQFYELSLLEVQKDLVRKSSEEKDA